MSKVVLITGAARGIGAGLAVHFAQAGYTVAINCRSQQSIAERGSQVEADCRAKGTEAACFAADVSDFEACGLMVAAVKERFGRIDVLVNNAGITRDGLMARMSEESFDNVVSSNLKSAFNMIRHITPVMMKQRGGSIINMSSVVGLSGNKGQANYAASKAGLIGLTKSVARELGGRGITCNAIAPGFIASDMSEAIPDAMKEAILAGTALGRFGTVEDVAKAALFLAEHGFITGEVLEVSGGLVM